MSRTPSPILRELEKVKTPDYETVLSKTNEWLCKTGFSTRDLAPRVDLADSTLRLFLGGTYESRGGDRDTKYVCARLWPYIQSHWPEEETEESAELLETQAYQKIRDCVEEALDEGAISVVYGPPSSEKSFVLKHLCAQFRKAGRDALYVYCGAAHSASSILREISAKSSIWLRVLHTRLLMNGLRAEFMTRDQLPALIFDEAQHLTVEALEIIRELHDRTQRSRRKGCGIVLAGSHNLYRDFEKVSRRPALEQWLSRIDYRVQLEGMTRGEALQIAARAFGNGKPAKFTPQQEEKLLDRCTVKDPYANPPRDYYSSRRLLKYIRQQKKNVKSVLAENVA